MKCTLVSITDKQEEPEVNGIFVQAVNGELGILTGHAPLIAKLRDCSPARLETAAGSKVFTLGTDSFLRFAGQEATILTSHFSVSKN